MGLRMVPPPPPMTTYKVELRAGKTETITAESCRALGSHYVFIDGTGNEVHRIPRSDVVSMTSR